MHPSVFLLPEMCPSVFLLSEMGPAVFLLPEMSFDCFFVTENDEKTIPFIKDAEMIDGKANAKYSALSNEIEKI